MTARGWANGRHQHLGERPPDVAERSSLADLGHTGDMSAEDVGRLARRLTTGLYVHAAALELVRDPRVRDLTPTGNPGDHPPAGLVQRKDGTLSGYDWLHHLNVAMDDPDMAAELDRTWLVSALVVLGDRLAAEDYFDRAPLLEMVRHLRNGVGHGNRFEIRDPGALLERPAHTRNAACRTRQARRSRSPPISTGPPCSSISWVQAMCWIF